LVYVSGAVSTWGSSVFVYLRHASAGSIIGTINPTTHAVTDRMNLGTNLLSSLTFAATDVGYGANLFYCTTAPISAVTTNQVTTFITNTVTIVTTNIVSDCQTNILVTFTPTNTVTAIGVDVCQNRTVGAAANCLGPIPATTGTGQLVSKPTVVNGAFSLTFLTAIGETYTLEYKTEITDPTWTPLQVVPGTGSSQTLTDLSAAGHPTRFYRIAVAP